MFTIEDPRLAAEQQYQSVSIVGSVVPVSVINEPNPVCRRQTVQAVQHGIAGDAELEALRYGPGGRAHFADPRPGDFPGRGTQREAELELEAG